MHAAHEYARKWKTAMMNVRTEAGNKRVEKRGNDTWLVKQILFARTLTHFSYFPRC